MYGTLLSLLADLPRARFLLPWRAGAPTSPGSRVLVLSLWRAWPGVSGSENSGVTLTGTAGRGRILTEKTHQT